MNATSEPVARCPEMYRSLPGSWQQCRRDAHDPAERHHAAGISWTTSAPTPVLRYETCTDPACCLYAPRVLSYFGASAAPAKLKARRSR